MNKKKIISTLTAAGMLATAGVTGVFAADETKTPSLGEFTNLVEGKTAIALKLQSETDRVTGKDLKIAYPGATISVADDAVLKTGDVVRVNGESRTIVIYGDVNKDGEVDIYDVTTIVNSVASETPLTGVELAAADLNRDGVADIYDLTRVVGSIADENYADMKVTLPKEEVAKVSNIEISVDGTSLTVKYDKDSSENTYALYDNKAKADVDFTVVYNSTDDEATLNFGELTEAVAPNADQTYTLTIKDKKGNVVSTKTFKYNPLSEIVSAEVENVEKANGEKILNVINSENQNSLSVKVTVETVNDKDATVVVTLKDTALKEVTGTATLAKNALAVSVNNFSGVKDLKDGEVSIEVKVIDADGNTVKNEDLDNLTKNTDSYKIVNIEAVRNGDELATEPIVEIDNATANQTKYYLAKKSTESAPTVDEIISDEDNKYYTNVRLEENVGYTLYVVAVNDDLGVKSDVASVKLAKATATQLDTVEAPEATENDGEFTWEDNNEKAKVSGYKVILYDVTGDAEKVVTTKQVTSKTVDMLKEIKDYVADNKDSDEFAVKVVALAAKDDNQNSEQSDWSDVYTTNALANPTVTVGNYSDTVKDEESNHQKLTWNAVDNASMYQINIYKYDKVDDDFAAEEAIKTIKTASTAREYDLTKALSSLAEGKYDVKVIALALTDSKYVDSDEDTAVAQTVFNFKAPTDLTLEAKGIDGGKVKVEATYTEVVDHNKLDGLTYDLYYAKKPMSGDATYDNTNVAQNLDKTVFTDTITGLDFDSTYYVMVVVHDVNGYEIARTGVESIKTQKEQVEINALKVVDIEGATTIANGEISYDGNKLLIGTSDGMVTCEDNDDYAKYSVVLPIVKALAVNDTITVDEDENEIYVTIKTTGHDYGTALANVDAVLVENAGTIAGTFKKVVVLSDGANLTNATVTDKILLVDNYSIKVKSNTKVEVNSDEGAKINNIEIDSKATVIATANGLEIKGEDADLTVTLTGDVKKNSTIKFTGTDTTSVTINNNSADNKEVSITSEYPVALTVEAGTVEVSDLTFTTLSVTDGKVKTSTPKTLKKNTLLKQEVVIEPTSGTVTIDSNKKISGNATITIKDVAGVEKEDKAQTIDVSEHVTLGEGVGNIVKIENTNGSTTYTITENYGDIVITSTGDTVISNI